MIEQIAFRPLLPEKTALVTSAGNRLPSRRTWMSSPWKRPLRAVSSRAVKERDSSGSSKVARAHGTELGLGSAEHTAGGGIGRKDRALLVNEQDRIQGILHDRTVTLLALPQRFLGPLAVGDVADRLDGPDYLSLLVAQESGYTPEIGSFAFIEQGSECFRIKGIAAPFDKRISFFDFLPIVEKKIDENGATASMIGNGVFKVAAAEHLVFALSRHLFDGPVPRRDCSLRVDREGCIGQKVDDFGQSLFRFPQRLPRPSAHGDSRMLSIAP